MVGDLFIVDGTVYRVAPTGFQRIGGVRWIESKKEMFGGINLGPNEYEPGPINEDFDKLVFAGG